jgi:hypothetical protein
MLEQIELLRKIDPEYAQLEGTAFEHVVGAFDRLINDMIDSLVSFLSKLIRTALTQYRRERYRHHHCIIIIIVMACGPIAGGIT